MAKYHTKQLIKDFDAMFTALRALGGLREPEIAAATGLSEDRVYQCCKHWVALGYLVRRKQDGEIRLCSHEEFVLADTITKAEHAFAGAL